MPNVTRRKKTGVGGGPRGESCASMASCDAEDCLAELVVMGTSADAVDAVDAVDAADAADKASENTTFATFKMKLNGLCTNANIKGKVNHVVLQLNRVAGEAYAFANFHVTRLIAVAAAGTAPVLMPVPDRNFYYRCIMAVTRNNVRESTLSKELQDSMKAFREVRGDGSEEVDIRGGCYNQMVADLSIVMGTAAKNHLWTNLAPRLTKYLSWRHPRLSKGLRNAVVKALVETPKVDLDKLFPGVAEPKSLPSSAEVKKLEADVAHARRSLEDLTAAAKAVSRRLVDRDAKAMATALAVDAKATLSERTARLTELKATRRANRCEAVEKRNAKVYAAKAIAQELRGVMALPSAGQFDKYTPILLRLYAMILRETIAAKAAAGATFSTKRTARCFKGRTFTLLPLKNGYTISHVQWSSTSMVLMLKSMGLENFEGDGRAETGLDHRAVWDRHFNLKAFETRGRPFALRIVTDGVSVSVLVQKRSCLCCPSTATAPETKLALLTRAVHEDGTREWDEGCRVCAVDPGVTDIATVARDDGTVLSYSSARYYEKAHYNTSRRRTNRWNRDTEDLLKDMPSAEVTDHADMTRFARRYLQVLGPALAHRAHRGYRNMRLLRYAGKQAAIAEIVEMIAPKGRTNIVGMGDWSGLGNSPISRRTSGPLQEIKLELRRREDVVMDNISEMYSSQRCNHCFCKLSNQKAVNKAKDDRGIQRSVDVAKVHKLLHCRTSDGSQTGCCGKTWDRDVNASRNLLMLTLCEILGVARPSVFCRPTTNTSSSRACEGVQAESGFPLIIALYLESRKGNTRRAVGGRDTPR